MFRLVVLSVALAVASANPSAWGGWGNSWNAGIVGSWGAPIATPYASIAAPIAAAPLAAVAPIGAYNYRGPWSLAPGQPANILAADGRPLDTLSVNLDRAAHITAKAVEGRGHLLKKRSIVSAPVIAAPLAASWATPAVAVSQQSRIDIPSAGIVASPWGYGYGAGLRYGAGYGYGAGLGYGVGLRYGAGLGQLW